jgi:hypothetical protein
MKWFPSVLISGTETLTIYSKQDAKHKNGKINRRGFIFPFTTSPNSCLKATLFDSSSNKRAQYL